MDKKEEAPTIKVRLFKNKLLYWLGILGSSASVMCLVYVMCNNPDWRNLYIALTSCLYIIMFVILSIYLSRERQNLLKEKYAAQVEVEEVKNVMMSARLELKQAKVLEKLFPLSHSINHAFRCEYERIKNHPILTLDDIKNSKFLSNVASNLKIAYDTLTGESCSICFKLHIEKQGMLIPIARDAASAAQRELFANWGIGGYGATTVKSNTASGRIINNGENYFVEDNLINLNDKEGYDNNRKDWAQIYRSTLVLPIRYYNEATLEKDIPAILGIDSKAINIFDNDVCIEMGAAVTDMLYTFFKHPNFEINVFPKLSNS